MGGLTIGGVIGGLAHIIYSKISKILFDKKKWLIRANIKFTLKFKIQILINIKLLKFF